MFLSVLILFIFGMKWGLKLLPSIKEIIGNIFRSVTTMGQDMLTKAGKVIPNNKPPPGVQAPAPTSVNSPPSSLLKNMPGAFNP